MKIGGLLKLGAGLYGSYQQYQHGKDLEDAADESARLLEEENAEERRRARKQQRQRQSTLRARAAASGIDFDSGSTQTFLKDQVKEDENQLSWLAKSGKSRADLLRKQGDNDKKNAQYGAYASFFNTVGDWWQRK